MSSNTIQRIISALVIIIIVVICLYFGIQASLGLIGLFGVLVLEEFLCNFVQIKRFSVDYIFNISIFILSYFGFSYFVHNPQIISAVNYLAVAICLVQIIYLFYNDMDSKSEIKFIRSFPFLFSLAFSVIFNSLGTIRLFEEWKLILGILLFINYGMDTGAWFFGKNFGKNKLWPKVSPNKTIEGFIGGIIFSGILGGIFWNLWFHKMSVILFFFFCFLGLISQVGDLIQSKLKRKFEIKDSGNLIPGHGGVYDRLDSLIFLTPFFMVALKYIR